MDSKIFVSKGDIIQNLLEVDHKLNKYKLENPLKMYIFGGTAVLLYTNYRATTDIDAFFENGVEKTEVIKLLNQYNINNALIGVMEIPPFEDFSVRAEKLDVDFVNIEVYIASKEDIIISKIFTSRGSPKDIKDIVQSGLLDEVNLDVLKALYDDYIQYITLPKHRYYSFDEVMEEYRKYKEKRK